MRSSDRKTPLRRNRRNRRFGTVIKRPSAWPADRSS